MGEEAQGRALICRIARDLFARGYTAGSSGNISMMLDDGWLMTPTDASFGRLEPERLSRVNLAGEWIGGDRPSKTLALHRGIYAGRPGTRAVLHTHSTHLVALTLQGVHATGEILPPITPYQVMKVGRIPLIAYDRPGSPDVAQQVMALAPHVRGVMLDRLGPVVWGRSLAEAADTLEELEETARLWLMTDPRPVPLGAEALEQLKQVFGVEW